MNHGYFFIAVMLIMLLGAAIDENRSAPATPLPVYAEPRDTLLERHRLAPYGNTGQYRLEIYYDTMHIIRLYWNQKGKRVYLPETFYK